MITVEQVADAIVEEVLSKDDKTVMTVAQIIYKVCKEKFGIEDVEKEVEYDGIDACFSIFNELKERSRDKSNPFTMRAVPIRGEKWGLPYNFEYTFWKKS